jgi:hypothetical protein
VLTTSDICQILVSTRQSSVLNAFLEALTRGGPNGLPRPIEIHAHDPTRYVGDMLAWIHQATASEHEFLSSLFGLEERRRMIGSKRSEEREEDETLVAEILDKNLEGLGRPLKVGHTENFECFADSRCGSSRRSRAKKGLL